MKYPYVRQRDIKDCGAACLLMIIKYYGGYIPINKLKEMTHTSKEGVSAYNLKCAGESIGFKVEGLKINNIDNIKLPAIAHVTINNFNHYIVIYEIRNNELVIGDPRDKIKIIPKKEFYKIFNNIILSFELIKKIPSYEKEMKFSKFIYKNLINYKKYIIHSFIYSILISLLSVIISFQIELISNKISLLFFITIIFLFIYLIKNILFFIRNNALFKIQKELTSNLTKDIYQKIIKLPYEYFKTKTTGEVITRFNDISQIIETSLKIILTLFIDILFSVITIFIIFNINKLLSLICILIYLIYLLVSLLFNKYVIIKIKKLKEEESSLNSYLYETINNFETIKGLSIEKNIISKYNDQNTYFINDNYKLNKFLNIENIICNMIKDVGLLLILFIGANLVIKNILKIEQLFTISLLYLYFISPVESIVNLTKDIKDSKISYERISELFYDYKDINNKVKLKCKKIKIRNLSFDYYGKKEVLNNININLKKNKIMILGESGSGKSTILKLIKRYYKIPDKKIFIDNIDINKIPINTINNNIKYVSQNENLFTDTLYNNIKLYRNINVDKYIKTCNINTDNMIIEENGFNISGGERQKIILARSLIENFKILILDEVFSQMDVNLERKILKQLFKKYPDKKIIVVSHRNNNIDLFDQVINISHGKVMNNIERRTSYV